MELRCSTWFENINATQKCLEKRYLLQDEAQKIEVIVLKIKHCKHWKVFILETTIVRLTRQTY